MPGDVYAGTDGVGGGFYGDFAWINGSQIWIGGISNPWSKMPTPIAEAPVGHVDDILFEVHYQIVEEANLITLTLPWDDKSVTLSDVWIDRFQLQFAQDYWFGMGSSGMSDGSIVVYTEMMIPVGTWITFHFALDDALPSPHLYEFYNPTSLFPTDPKGAGYIVIPLVGPPMTASQGLSPLGRSW